MLGENHRLPGKLKPFPAFAARNQLIHANHIRARGGEALLVLFTCAAENPNRRLRMMALADRVSMRVDRASFDDLVTLVTQAPTM